ncbi:HAMP domain-containing methyl-accepting chemotaxis protein [Maridesulfovibrio hydrothermalis]|uniref:Methyl-accepting chemotaxis sensory transducer n=1 Tax=Maridesulfovibrio hydrothermalis AM13 = DSM 14728 TaxID=1121451 RepID=L0R9T9_9BACT|nr:methyl-accepting chemotaxis protein [Maridesulfovibrio hydrothermalis]CCO22977.1 Methyl-accepting chemotaxis sensory transducer [Maridesulfovibrio hydrothermalis AM13 = DSM 14728]
MNLLSNMKVGVRIGLLAAILLLLMVASAGIGLNLTASSNSGLETVYLDRIVPLKQLKIISDEYAVNVVDTSHKVRSGALTWSQGIHNLDVAQKKIAHELEAYLATELVQDEVDLVKEIKPLLVKADASIKLLRSIFESHNTEKLVSYINKELYPVIDPVTEVIARLIDVQLVVASQVYSKAEATFHGGQQVMIFIIISAVILAILITFFIGRSLTSQLGGEPQTIQHIASRIAAGDLKAASEINRSKAQGVSKAMLEINDSLTSISQELESAVGKIRLGELRFRGDANQLSGFFAAIMDNSNNLADSLVNYLDDIANPITCFSINQETLFMNKASTDSTDLTPAQSSREKCIKFFQNSGCSGSNCPNYETILNGTDLSSKEMHDNSDITVSYTGIPIVDENENLTGIFEILVDQTAVVGMQRKIANLAEQASTISERLSSSASDLSNQVDEASGGAQIQSARTAETATAMEEMNATVLEVAQNAGRAADNTNLTKDKALHGADVVEKVVDAIGEVQRQADSLKVDTEEMGKQAEAIGNIIEVISDIADQTNLLALNAAIEAARAGEAGRGFAVVADEVRKLAEKTMTATTEVNNAISAIQDSSRKNIISTESAAKTVGKSTELANQAGDVLKEIVAFSDSSSEQVQSIAAASEQQSATAEEITRSTEEVDKISQETSSAMNEAARSVDEIATMTRELDKLVQAMVSS